MSAEHYASPEANMGGGLSVAIIARNEAHAIRACLESIAWADEIVVLDSGSTDATVEICRAFGAKVEITDWPGYGAQKNRAIGRCCGAWILSLDADERVSPALRAEVERAIAEPSDAAAYRMPRLSSYCGRPMRHSGWWPDHVTRLFRRGRGHFSDDLVHERLIVDGRTRTLHEPLLHDTCVDLDEVLDKLNAYSSAGARQMLARGKRGSLGRAIGHGLWTFLRTYVLRAGFLDGREGFMLAVSNAEGAYYRYLKLMLLERTGADRGSNARSID
jgi:glycosyltransferase involved in cell wall biosynthesis